MAVRHGYGKIAGTDALVFAYDTGDTINSYKGEPTTNLASTEASRTLEQYADNVVIPSEAPERGPGWKKVTITSRGTNFRTAKFPYITQPTNTVRTYSFEIDFNGTSGYYIRGDGFTGFGGNLYTSGIYSTTFTTTTNSGALALFLNNATTSVSGINDIIYYRYYQVEDKSHRTQFTTGTRSATQGLLDLTGKNTINLTSAGFDTNAQIVFNGTTNYIDCGNTSITNLNGNNFSLAAIFLSNNISSTQTIMCKAEGGGYALELNAGDTNLAIALYISGAYRRVTYPISNLQSNKSYYVVATYNNSEIVLYVNGVAVNSMSFSGSVTTVNVPMLVGANPSPSGVHVAYLNGKVFLSNIYNRALTAAEVLINYNHYKTRFNL